jgi:hypothetical protein
MLTTKFRTTVALLAAALLTVAISSFGFMAVGPVTAARAQAVNPEMSQDEACGMLQDAYNSASAIASQARAAGNERVYEIWSNIATEAYLDAEFDYQCDWVQDIVVHKPVTPAQGRFPVGSSAFLSGPAGPPASAGSNVHAFHQWLVSKNHTLTCSNLHASAASLQTAATRATRQRQAKTATGLAGEAKLIKVTAELSRCG